MGKSGLKSNEGMDVRMKRLKDFFGYDGTFMNVMGDVADLIGLNMLFLIGCIPLITIGCSLKAMSAVTLKMTSGEDYYVAKDFLYNYWRGWKQSIIVGGICVLGSVLLIWNAEAVSNSVIETAYHFIQIIPISILTFVILYAFPVLAVYDWNVRKTLKQSLLLALLDFPFTIIMAGIIWGIVLLARAGNPEVLTVLLMGFCLIGFAGIARINSSMIGRTFRKMDQLIEAEERGWNTLF